MSLGTAPQGAQGSADAVRQLLQEEYRRAGAAYASKEPDALLALITADFQQQMPDGQIITREVAEAGLREWFSTADAVTGYEVQVGPVTIRGNDAILMVDETVRTRWQDPQGKHERVQKNSARVTWTETPAGWKIRRSDYVNATLTVDGHPVKPFYTP